ncbi:MAG TPA: zinc ribbon domain-containing protein [Dongiaceae bacterium]|nr:zinc ribbon domain-containing protein [Dongiaceae bacterium]
MAEVVQSTPQEFWRPPVRMEQEVGVLPTVPRMAEACPRCGTEFLLGSRFCHSCGGKRPEAVSSMARADAATVAGWWERGVQRIASAVSGIPWRKIKLPPFPSWLHYLHFHEIKSRLALSTGSLIAFVIGLVCIAGALLVGLMTARTLVDWQAIQLYRLEWLAAATASFVAGILLKKPSRD